MEIKDAIFVSLRNYPSIHQSKSNNQTVTFLLSYIFSELSFTT